MLTEWLNTSIAFAALVIGLVNRHKIQQVHVSVDGNFHNLLDKLGVSQVREVQLTDTLRDSGVAIPDKTRE